MSTPEFIAMSQKFVAKCDEVRMLEQRLKDTVVSFAKREVELELIIKALQRKVHDCPCAKK